MSRGVFAALLMTMLGACAAAPPASVAPVAAEVATRPNTEPPAVPEPARLIESPPMEPVAPEPARVAAVQPEPEPSPPPAPDRNAQVAVVPPPDPVPPAPPPPQVIIAEPSAEEREFAALLGDLQRYTSFSADELRRETQAMTQAIARGRGDANRVRLAVLYTLSRQSAQDDQRALQLFETVAKSNPTSAAIRQLATVLSVQVSERVRAVRDEQARSEAAIQKLEALRAMERSLLRDRVRSGGGGGGAGSGGGN